jgi:ribonuclease Z
LCDTTTSIYEEHKQIFDYKWIICECTFLDADTYDLAKKSKHTHWFDLRDIIVAHPENMFILIHFSMRYDHIVIPDLPKNAIIWKSDA